MKIIRRIEREDVGAFRALLEQWFAHAGNPWPGDDAFYDFVERISRPEAGLVFFGAFDGPHLEGMASVAYVDSSYLFRPFAYCDDVFVVPAARRHNVARELMQHVETQARHWGATSILLGAAKEGTPARFYERVGYRDMGNQLYFHELADS